MLKENSFVFNDLISQVSDKSHKKDNKDESVSLESSTNKIEQICSFLNSEDSKKEGLLFNNLLKAYYYSKGVIVDGTWGLATLLSGIVTLALMFAGKAFIPEGNLKLVTLFSMCIGLSLGDYCYNYLNMKKMSKFVELNKENKKYLDKKYSKAIFKYYENKFDGSFENKRNRDLIIFLLKKYGFNNEISMKDYIQNYGLRSIYDDLLINQEKNKIDKKYIQEECEKFFNENRV